MKRFLFFVVFIFVIGIFCGNSWGTTEYHEDGDISDTAYDATIWDGKTEEAASKNAIRDKLETMGGAGGAPTNAKYIVQQADGTLSAEQALGALATGLLRSTNGTGVIGSIPISSDVEAMLGSANDTALRTETGAAASGANADITSMSGLTTPLSVANGGTGSANATGARTNLGAAASGNNTDITHLDGPALGTPSSGNLGNCDSYPSATPTTEGIAELATTAEVNTGNDISRVPSVDALAGSIFGQKDIGWTIYDSDDNTTVANGKKGYAVPASMDTMELIDFTCSVYGLNGATGGTTTVMLRRVRGAAAADMLSVGTTIAHDAYTASDETVDANNDDLNTGDILFCDVDAITSGHPHQGLSCTAIVGVP